MLTQHYLNQIGQHPQTAPEGLAAFFANPDQFIQDAAARGVISALANWQPSAAVTPAVDLDELHDVPAAAKLLGVVPQTIHDYVKREILTPLRLRPGGKLYFKKSALVDALTRNGAGQRPDGRRKAGRAANKKG